MYPIKVKIRGCSNLSELKDFIKLKKIKLVLFAETHGFLKENIIQKKILKEINPEFFLYELLEENELLNNIDARKFLNKSSNKDFSVISTYGELKPTIKLASDLHLPIIGCDIKNMCRKNKDFLKITNLSSNQKRIEDKILKRRELHQSKIITKYVSKGLVFASLGVYHLRKNSFFLKSLKEKEIIIVKPLFNGRDELGVPANFLEHTVSYVVKLVKI
jgi:hypothetical protein